MDLTERKDDENNQSYQIENHLLFIQQSTKVISKRWTSQWE